MPTSTLETSSIASYSSQDKVSTARESKTRSTDSLPEYTDAAVHDRRWSHARQAEQAGQAEQAEQAEQAGQAAGRGGAETSLPPADGGRAAYLFMLSAFAIEAFMWGLPLSFGVFQAFYKDNPKSDFFHNDFIAVIGVLGTGIPFLGAPLVTPFTTHYHRYRQQMVWTGTLICILSLVAASFATKTWHLILSQGLGYGFGFLILYYAMLSMLNEWFIKRRGLAYGLLFAAAGLSGTGLPFALTICINRFGFRITLRGCAVLIAAVVAPTLPLLKGRIPPESAKLSPATEWRILCNPLFFTMSLSNVFQGLVFYLPGLYLVSYSRTLGLTDPKATLVLCVLNLSQVAGQVIMGFVSDMLNVHIPLLVSCAGSAAVVLTLWLMAKDMAWLIAFAVLYGVLAGGYTSLFARFSTALTEDNASQIWVYGLFAFERGAGNIVAAPICVALLRVTDGYTAVIWLTGLSLVVATLGGFGWLFQKERSWRCAR